MGKGEVSELPSEQDRTVFISGLPYQSSEEEIKAIFVDCGQIEHIKLPKFQDTGRLLGYGHLVFKTTQGANKALEKDKVTIGSRYITIAKAKGEKPVTQQTDSPPETCKTVFVKNLPFTITSEEIGDAFKHCGPIVNVRMVFNSNNQLFKGFCYVDFKSPDSVRSALKMSGKDFRGRNLFVDFDVGKPKQGFKYGQQQMTDDKYNKDVNEIKHKKIKKEKLQKKVDNIKNYGKTQKEELAKKKRQEDSFQ